MMLYQVIDLKAQRLVSLNGSIARLFQINLKKRPFLVNYMKNSIKFWFCQPSIVTALKNLPVNDIKLAHQMLTIVELVDITGKK